MAISSPPAVTVLCPKCGDDADTLTDNITDGATLGPCGHHLSPDERREVLQAVRDARGL